MTDLATAPSRPAEPDTSARRGSAGLVLWPLLGLAVAVGAWWILSRTLGLQSFILPAPEEVWASFRQYPEVLLNESWSTTKATLLGFGISVVVGVLIGVAIASWRPVERMFQPLLVAFNAVPKVALAPLMLIWFGYGPTPVLAMAVMVCFFPIVLSTATGLTSTPADLAELVRSMDASRMQTFRSVRLPAALPQIFVGLKIAMPLSVIGVVVGEMQYGESGLGMVIVSFSGQADTASAFAGIISLAVISIVLYYALVAIERMLLPWVRAITSAR